MEQSIVITIGVWKMLTLLAGLIAATWYASSRLTKVETEVKGFDKRLTGVEGRLDASFASNSPVQLLPRGEEILQGSGLKKFIDANKDTLLEHCKTEFSMKNPYDIQESAFRLLGEYDFGDFQDKLKEAAYKYGSSMEVVRRIGAIYFRDICLDAHGFKPEDLDK